MMLTEPQKPLLILCCSSNENISDFDLNQFISKMELNEIANIIENVQSPIKFNTGLNNQQTLLGFG